MRKLPESGHVYETVDMVRVHLDDLAEVVALLRSMGLTPVIHADGYEFDSLDELRSRKGDRITQFEIKGSPPDGRYDRASIRFEKSRAVLSISDADALGPGAYRLRDLVRGLRHPGASLLGFQFWWFLGVALWVLSLTIAHVSAQASEVMNIGSLAAYGVGLLVFVGRRPLIGAVLRYRHEGGFIKRNRDALLLLVAGALIGAVLTRGLELLTGKR